MTLREQIDDFMAQKRLAVAGVSRKGGFSRMLVREFVQRGYDVVPVNPHADEIDGRRCFHRLQDVEPPVDAVLVMTSSTQSEQVARDAAEAGVRRVWFYRAIGWGALDEDAVKFCEQNDISVIPGHCPLMFLPRPGILHRPHALILKLFGKFPK